MASTIYRPPLTSPAGHHLNNHEPKVRLNIMKTFHPEMHSNPELSDLEASALVTIPRRLPFSQFCARKKNILNFKITILDKTTYRIEIISNRN